MLQDWFFLLQIRHAKRQVAHDRLALLHGVNQLVTVATQLLASPSFWQSSEPDEVTAYACSLFHLSETYNSCLESCWTHVEASLAAANPSLASTPSDADSGNEMGTTVSPGKIRVLVQVKAANTNDAPLLKQSLKPLSATRLLQVIAQRRALFASCEFTRRTFTCFYENQKAGLGVEKFSQCLEEESLHLRTFEKAFSQRPSILGRAAVKEQENGELRLTKSFKLRMYAYFHEVLWSLVGEYSEDFILWSLQTAVPLTLQPSEMQIALRQALMLGAHAQGTWQQRKKDYTNFHPMRSPTGVSAMIFFTILQNLYTSVYFPFFACLSSWKADSTAVRVWDDRRCTSLLLVNGELGCEDERSLRDSVQSEEARTCDSHLASWDITNGHRSWNKVWGSCVLVYRTSGIRQQPDDPNVAAVSRATKTCRRLWRRGAAWRRGANSVQTGSHAQLRQVVDSSPIQSLAQLLGSSAVYCLLATRPLHSCSTDQSERGSPIYFPNTSSISHLSASVFIISIYFLSNDPPSFCSQCQHNWAITVQI